MPGEKANARTPHSPSLLSLRRHPRAARADRKSSRATRRHRARSRRDGRKRTHHLCRHRHFTPCRADRRTFDARIHRRTHLAALRAILRAGEPSDRVQPARRRRRHHSHRNHHRFGRRPTSRPRRRSAHRRDHRRASQRTGPAQKFAAPTFISKRATRKFPSPTQKATQRRLQLSR